MDAISGKHSQPDEAQSGYTEFLITVDQRHVTSSLSSNYVNDPDQFQKKFRGNEWPVSVRPAVCLEGNVSCREGGGWKPIERMRGLLRNDGFEELVKMNCPLYFSSRPGRFDPQRIFGGLKSSGQPPKTDLWIGTLAFFLQVPPDFWNNLSEYAREFVPDGSFRIILKTIRLAKVEAWADGDTHRLGVRAGIFAPKKKFGPVEFQEPIHFVYGIRMYGSNMTRNTPFDLTDELSGFNIGD